MSAWSKRLVGVFVHAYPARLRGEFGGEIRGVISELALRAEYRGPIGRLRLGLFLFWDVVLTIARERVAKLPGRSVPPIRPRVAGERDPYGDAFLAALAVFALYIATLAPTVAFWDSGEYLTAAHTLGIPHPPGNPLFVLLAHSWERLLAPLGLSPAIRLNLFSAAMSATAHFFWFLVVYRASIVLSSSVPVRRLSAALAVLLSATAFSVWNQSNVSEKVYTVSLLTVALVSWLALRWRASGGSTRWLVLIAFVLALTSANHLLGVLVVPAVFLYVIMVDARVLLRGRLWAGALLAVFIGLTPHFFLPVRAAQRPILNENDPACADVGQAALSIYTWGRTGCTALSDSFRRDQYYDPPITVDRTTWPQQAMPRGPRLFASQLANYGQYFNWQWARGLGGSDSLLGGLRPLLTLLFLVLGLVGARAQWQRDRAGASYLTMLFLTLSLGLVVYLNFEWGFAMHRDTVPDPRLHEVRERDYFFLISFSVWGLWAGLGLVKLWQQITHALSGRLRYAPLFAAPVLVVSLLPLGLNWEWASRANDYTARDWAYNVLMSVEPYGVLFTNGDNDTFPLWYLQEVENVRRDVTVLVTSYLNTPWYARQMRDLTRPCENGQRPDQAPTRIVCQRNFEAEAMPVALRQQAARAPEDSILPMSDAQIDEVAGSHFVVKEPLSFRAGELETTIPAGTEMLPADTFVAAIVQSSLGERPIHFTTPSPVTHKLGLFDHTVRRGLTFKLSDGRSSGSAHHVRMPENELTSVTGAAVDLSGSELLLNQVFTQQGRVLDLSKAWVDEATTDILLQYTWLHFALAQAYAERGDQARAQQHVRRGEWWQRRAGA
jgi:transmembrane protein TMEM260 (protein O-mannosyltransferase)